MSITSKVNENLRTAIIIGLGPGTSMTNSGIKAHLAPTTSLRTIQEATQKMTREGKLVTKREYGKTWYSVPTPATTVQQ